MSASDVTFAGSIPAIYEQHLGPLLFQPYAEDLAARLRDIRGGRILETAAGTGIVTRALVRTLPAAVEIVATDFNQTMIDVAASLLQAPNVTWQQADAQALPFQDAEFEAVICQFGVMFFPDRPRAYREALRVLKLTGCFLFNVWDRLAANDFSDCVTEAVAAQFPHDPPRFLDRIPYGHFDPDLIREELRQAGFRRIDVEPVEKISRAPSARDPAVGLCQGTPLRSEIEARDASRLDEVTDKAAEAVAARFGRSSIEGRMRAYVVTAWRT
jgi:ubiquinone/menaquinone biosynthesis C-methylase UbiE